MIMGKAVSFRPPSASHNHDRKTVIVKLRPEVLDQSFEILSVSPGVRVFFPKIKHDPANFISRLLRKIGELVLPRCCQKQEQPRDHERKRLHHSEHQFRHLSRTIGKIPGRNTHGI